MQAVVIALAIAEQQRRGLGLSLSGALIQEAGMQGGEVSGLLQGLIPCGRDGSQALVELFAQLLHQGRQRVRKVLILAAAKAIPGHVDAAPEARFVLVHQWKLEALRGLEELAQGGVAVFAEFGLDSRPFGWRHDAQASGPILGTAL